MTVGSKLEHRVPAMVTLRRVLIVLGEDAEQEESNPREDQEVLSRELHGSSRLFLFVGVLSLCLLSSFTLLAEVLPLGP